MTPTFYSLRTNNEINIIDETVYNVLFTNLWINMMCFKLNTFMPTLQKYRYN